MQRRQIAADLLEVFPVFLLDSGKKPRAIASMGATSSIFPSQDEDSRVCSFSISGSVYRSVLRMICMSSADI